VRVGAVLVAALVPPILAAIFWSSLRTWQPLGFPGLVETSDPGVYFRSSSWVVGQGTLYVNVPSEYPLLANLFFALVRLVSGALNTQPTALLSFEVTWVTCGWWMWLAVLFLLWRNAPRRAIWLWLNPAALYFSLYRFDVYLVAGTLLCLLAARDGRIRTAALLLGATVALKGFAILFVPAFALWVWQNKGRREAAIATALAVGPMAASLALIFVLSGLTAMLYPFRFQAVRTPDGDTSTWDTIIPFGIGAKIARHIPLLPFVLEVGSALVAAVARPRTFQQLLRAYLIAVGGFLTFSAFYSAQFVLWLVAPVALSDSLAILVATVAIAWITPLFYPVFFNIPHTRLEFRIPIFLITVLRTAIFALVLIPARYVAGWTQSFRASRVRRGLARAPESHAP
jgi:hypothetical protein